MAKILKFHKFNEGWFSDFFGSDSKPYEKKMDMYDISSKSEGKHKMKFYHGGKLVAIIMLDEENVRIPNWILTIYLYEKETPKKNSNYEKPEKISWQIVQPYGKITQSMGNDSEDAIISFVNWWSKYTKSGRENNPMYQI